MIDKGKSTLVLFLILVGFCFIGNAVCFGEPIETVVPYSFPAGFINVVRYSEAPLEPFKNLIEEKYPLIKINYTVQNDGWLEMSRVVKNGSIPVIQINDENTFLTKIMFFTKQVYSGENYSLVMFPQENLNYSQSVEVSTGPMLIYELYDWDEMIGDIIILETPRREINTTLSWTPSELNENQRFTFSVADYDDRYSTIEWTLVGDGLEIVDSGSHLVTPLLDSGFYTVSVYIEDVFGYEKSAVTSIFVKPLIDSGLYDPSISKLDFVDIDYPTFIEPNTIQNITVLLNYSLPVPREIQLSILDASNGERLSTINDNLEGEDVVSYSLFFESKESTMDLRAEVEFLHEDEWISSGDSIIFALPVATPYEENSVPGFSTYALAVGVVFVFIQRRISMKELF